MNNRSCSYCFRHEENANSGVILVVCGDRCSIGWCAHSCRVGPALLSLIPYSCLYCSMLCVWSLVFKEVIFVKRLVAVCYSDCEVKRLCSGKFNTACEGSLRCEYWLVFIVILSSVCNV